MGKRKKNISNPTPDSSSSVENSTIKTNLELDNKALRIKNANLVKAVAKLQLEKAQLQTQITQLQEDYFKLNSTFVNMKNINSTIDGTVKTWFQKYVEFSEMFTKIMQLCSVGKTVSINKDPRTQAVQPHAVNGHVLQHPTISLSRLNEASNVALPRQQLNQNSSNPTEEMTETVQPSVPGVDHIQNEGLTEGLGENEIDVERIIFGRRRNIPIEPLNMDELQEQEDEQDAYEEISNGEEYCSRLFTIREEDGSNFDSSASPGRIISREVRIYIDRLPSDYVRRNVPFIRNRKTNTSNTSNVSLESAVLESENNSASLNPTSTSSNEVTCTNNSGSKTNATVIQETVYRHTMSPLKRREAQYFGEPSSFLQTSAEPSSMHSFSALQADQNLEIPDISAIQNVPSCLMSHAKENSSVDSQYCKSIECRKKVLFDNLGLQPDNPKITTSTPLILRTEEADSSREENSNTMISTMNSSTPLKKNRTIFSKVTCKRGGSDRKKVAQVVLDRMSFEERLPGSPAIKREKLSDIVVRRSSSLLHKRNINYKLSSSSSSSDSSSDSSYEAPKNIKKRYAPSSSSNDSSDVKENIDTSNRDDNILGVSNQDRDNTPRKSTSNPNKKRIGRPLTKGPKRLMSQQSPKKFKLSPRPKRAARPTTLKEPTLNKKMRRSK